MMFSNFSFCLLCMYVISARGLLLDLVNPMLDLSKTILSFPPNVLNTLQIYVIGNSSSSIIQPKVDHWPQQPPLVQQPYTQQPLSAPFPLPLLPLPILQPHPQQPYPQLPPLILQPYTQQPPSALFPYPQEPPFIQQPYPQQPPFIQQPYPQQPPFVQQPYPQQPPFVQQPYPQQPPFVQQPYPQQPPLIQPYIQLPPPIQQPNSTQLSPVERPYEFPSQQAPAYGSVPVAPRYAGELIQLYSNYAEAVDQILNAFYYIEERKSASSRLFEDDFTDILAYVTIIFDEMVLTENEPSVKDLQEMLANIRTGIVVFMSKVERDESSTEDVYNLQIFFERAMDTTKAGLHLYCGGPLEPVDTALVGRRFDFIYPDHLPPPTYFSTFSQAP